MKNQGMQKSENEKLLEFGIRLSNLVTDIEILKENVSKLKVMDYGKCRLYIGTDKVDAIKMDLDYSFVILLEQAIEKIIEQKTAELNELKKHITL